MSVLLREMMLMMSRAAVSDQIFIVQKTSDSNAAARTSTTLNFAKPTVGNMLVVGIAAYEADASYAFSVPTGWSLAKDAYLSGNTGSAGPRVYTRIADGTETSVLFSRTASSYISSAFFEIGGPPNGVAIDASSVGQQSQTGGVINLAPVTPLTAGTFALALSAWRGNNVAPSFSLDPAWDLQTEADQNVYYQLMTATQQQDDSLSPVTGSMTQSTDSTDLTRAGTVTLLFKPFEAATPAVLSTTPMVSVADYSARISFRISKASS